VPQHPAGRDRLHRTPLVWPDGRPRTPPSRRRRALFGESGKPVTVPVAVGRVRLELERLDARLIAVSSNEPSPHDGRAAPPGGELADPGVAVEIELAATPHCICCDHWDRLADNLAAIAKHLHAVHAQVRWGVVDPVEALAVFRTAPPGPRRRTWWEVLQFRERPTLIELRLQRRAMAARHHPDHGGDPDRMADINQAYQEALQDFGLPLERPPHK
jgi:hypothetical protein